MGRGFVHVVRSPVVSWTKIGPSDRAPHFGARELSRDPVHGAIGPWEVVDHRQVEDMQAPEGAIHKHFRIRQMLHHTTREVFDTPVEEACAKLIESAGANLTRGDLTGRLRLEPTRARSSRGRSGSPGSLNSWTCGNPGPFRFSRHLGRAILHDEHRSPRGRIRCSRAWRGYLRPHAFRRSADPRSRRRADLVRGPWRVRDGGCSCERARPRCFACLVGIAGRCARDLRSADDAQGDRCMLV